MKKETFTRFEINGIGIFHLLNKIDKIPETEFKEEDDFKYTDAVYRFEKDLPIPNLYKNTNKKTISFFTEEGLSFFKESIEDLVDVLETYIDKVTIITIKDIEKDKILYRDKYQIIIEK